MHHTSTVLMAIRSFNPSHIVSSDRRSAGAHLPVFVCLLACGWVGADVRKCEDSMILLPRCFVCAVGDWTSGCRELTLTDIHMLISTQTVTVPLL